MSGPGTLYVVQILFGGSKYFPMGWLVYGTNGPVCTLA